MTSLSRALGSNSRDSIGGRGTSAGSVLDGLDPEQSLGIVASLEVEGLIELLAEQTEAVLVLLSLGRIGFKSAALQGNVSSESVL